MFAARRSIHADRCVIHSAKPAYLDGATRFIDLIYTLAYWYSRGRLLHSCWNEWMVWSPIYVLFTLTDCRSTNRTDISTKILSADISVRFFAFVEPVHLSSDTCWPGQSFPKFSVFWFDENFCRAVMLGRQIGQCEQSIRHASCCYRQWVIDEIKLVYTDLVNSWKQFTLQRMQSTLYRQEQVR